MDLSDKNNNDECQREDEIQEYVDSLVIRLDDPILILHWDWNGLRLFADYINPNSVNDLPNLPQPRFPITLGPQTSDTTLMLDIVNYILHHLGPIRCKQKRPFSDLVLGPNSSGELDQLTAHIAILTQDPFIYHVLHHHVTLGLAAIKLGSFHIIYEKIKIVDAEHYDLKPGAVLCPFSA